MKQVNAAGCRICDIDRPSWIARELRMVHVWCGDEETFLGQLILLIDDAIVVATPEYKELDSIRQRLTAGESPASVLPDDARTIPFLSVTSIVTDKHDEDIEIAYSRSGENKEQTLRLINPLKRDEVYACLKTVFGTKFDEVIDDYSVPRAAIGSLLSLTICGGLTFIAANAAASLRAAESYEISGRHASSKALIAWLLEVLGPVGVSIVGGITCFLSAAMLYIRVRKPQTLMIMQEGTYQPGSKAGLVGKYLVLFFMWYLAARAAI